MVQNATNIITGDIRQPRIARLVMEQRLPVLPQRLVRMHARTIITSQRLRHKRCRLPMPERHILNNVFKRLQIIRGMQQRIELIVDLLLAPTNLMVEPL